MAVTSRHILEQQAEMRQLNLRKCVAWFFEKYAPKDTRDAAEFHADFMGVVQAVYSDASMETHELLRHSLAMNAASNGVLRPHMWPIPKKGDDEGS